jgi:GMP synthase-like glutamine amidotransferase
MAAWLSDRAAVVQYTRFFDAPELPDPSGPDFVIAMGGPMSVNDEDEHPWLRPEKAFLREAVQQGTAILGVCLGAQLIASALGARVYPNAHREIGWFPIEGIPVEGDVFRFPRKKTVFHWHGETFDLPKGAVRLARSDGCENQAFQVGRNVLGLQFHLETTPASAERILHHCRSEMTPGPYVQAPDALASAPASAYMDVNRLMGDLLAYLTRDIG